MIKRAVAKILPKEDKFFVLLTQLAAQARECAIHLKKYVEANNQQERDEAKRLVTEGRLGAKKIRGDITKQLCTSFITPFDREDIEDFARSLYKISKTIKKICDRLDIYEMLKQKSDFSAQTNLIVQEAEAMENMVRELTSGHDNAKQIIKMVEALHELEHRGDEVLNELLTSLFRDENDAKNLILRKDVYDMLEKVIDRYRDAAAIAMQIVLKHS